MRREVVEVVGVVTDMHVVIGGAAQMDPCRPAFGFELWAAVSELQLQTALRTTCLSRASPGVM